MNEMTIYLATLTCARVALVALEESGTKYANQLINVIKGEQKWPAYLAIHLNTDDVAAKGRDTIGPSMLRLQDRF